MDQDMPLAEHSLYYYASVSIKLGWIHYTLGQCARDGSTCQYATVRSLYLHRTTSSQYRIQYRS